ncbi:T9SS type A sorting domain-containing protein, partial [candidate division KSB1 bacterium]|nr:T9SS type A sorting domain-containing protein [candidate division KSB1 bacterium]
RPTDANALEDISLFLTHDPKQPLIYIPGVGSNITKRHERVPLKVRRFAGQFIKHADKDRVDAMNLVLHVDAFSSADPAGDSDYIVVSGSDDPEFTFSDEFLTHLQYWDEMLTGTIDPLVEAGYLQWSSHEEIAEAFIQWESGRQVSEDSLLTFVASTAAGTKGIAVDIRVPQRGRFSGAAPVVIYVPGGFNGRGIPFAGPGLKEQGFIEISFNFPGSGFPGARSGGLYDMRGPRSIEAMRDVVRFALGETGDINGNTLSDLCGSIQPQLNNVGLCGFSNGGNAALAVAGRYAAELSDLAWIVNWESPIGDGMPTAEAGDKGHESKANPYINPAYDPNSGEWDLNGLQYDAAVDVNKHHTSAVQEPLIGGFYFDINSNGLVDSGVDFVLSPISMERNGDIRVYYSERVTCYAETNGLLPAGAPAHLTGVEACEQFWRLRNGENWLDEIGTHLSHLKFIVVASDSDHVQTAPDHPHIMIQHNGLVNNGIAFSRVNADLDYIADILGATPANGVDNPANQLYDHQTIRDAVQPAGIAGLDLRTAVAAACCELADRTHYNILSPQLDGVITELTQVKSKPSFPETFTLQCYPNPFNPETVISWSVGKSGPVQIAIYNQLGQRLCTLVDNENVQPGTYTVRWNGRNAFGQAVAAGVYFYQLQSDDFVMSKKAILLR